MSPRLLVYAGERPGFAAYDYTIIHEERAFQGTWSKPDVPLLIFADNALPAGSSVIFHGGAIGTGLPVQLIFWGSWWTSPEGVGRQGLIVDRTRAVIESDYFSELQQYGVSRPNWRGAIVVTEPQAPGAFNSQEDAKAVPRLIDALIDDDVFPDPDNERIAFVVLMPKGFTQTIGANGAHTYDDDYDFPLDWDKSWVAWARYFDPAAGEDPETTIRTLTHELVEMFTDPETDAWYADPIESGEISDAGSSGGTRQEAAVNGARVASYWSNRHAATVIPIDRDYRAQIRGVTSEEARSVIATGSFRPDPSDSAACERVPECCMEDRNYTWTLYGFDEVAKLRLVTNRYQQPTAAWSIQGIAISGSGSLQVNLPVGAFSGRTPQASNQPVTISYRAQAETLEMHVAGSRCNFDVGVSCNVTDASIKGNVATNVIATPSVVVGFVGAQLELDPEYNRQRGACFAALVAQYNVNYERLSKVPGRGDPIDEGMIARLPAYARVEQYRRAQDALALARMAKKLLPAEDAISYARSMVNEIPVLSISTADGPTRNPNVT